MSLLGSLMGGLGSAIAASSLAGTIGSAITAGQSGKNNTQTTSTNLLTSPTSESIEDSFGDSWGGGSSWGEGSSWGHEESESSGFSDSQEEAWSHVYGELASAQDIIRAEEANKIAYDLWKAQADYNASEAELNRKFQAYMSNTAYQRAVEDLKKAGLNPILAAQSIGGATTPGGSVASSGLATSHKATTYADSHSESKGRSHSENSSHSYGENGSSQQSGSSQSNGSHNESHSKSSSGPLLQSLTDANKITAKAVSDYINGGSAKSHTEDYSPWRSFDESGYDPALY